VYKENNSTALCLFILKVCKTMKKESLLPLAGLSKRFSEAIAQLRFSSSIKYVYNPLDYAWEPHLEYISCFGRGSKRVLFVGMNPGPWGMVQTGIPFGDVPSVTGWLKIGGKVNTPAVTHPKRPVLGFNCPRREQSGRRFWGLMSTRFHSAGAFFQDHFVANYCPLVFFNAQGKNITPNALGKKDRDPLTAVCDMYLKQTVHLLQSRYIIGIGKFAEKRIRQSLQQPDSMETGDYHIGSILHPSPANPAANTGWAEKAARRLFDLGVWEE
jgi:single-strand selective monofunctional uracil DNA glycosylase